MLKFDDKEYRNLQEQVLKNMQDIEALKKKAELADLGINVVTPEPFASASQLPLPYAGDYGDGFLVGTEAPYTLYVWTRKDNEYNGKWFKWGLLNAPSVIPGPIGPQGIQGETGQRGSQWNSQTGNPTNIVGQLNYDQALNTQTGDVFQFVNGVWQKTGNIRGPQGIQGIQGIQGPIGPQGAQGLQGPTGPQGQFIEIIGTLENTGQLPAPATVPRSTAYLVTVDGAEHIYLIIGEGTEESPLVWHDAGAFGAGSGTKVLIGGVQQEQVDIGNLITRQSFIGNLYTDIKPLVTKVDGSDGFVDFSHLAAQGYNVLGELVNYKDNNSIRLPIGDSAEINATPKETDGYYQLQFELSDTYKQSVAQDIANAQAPQVAINAPTTATNGQLSEAGLTTLQSNNNAYILFNNEIYRLQDNQHDSGFLVYSHIGYDNTVNDYIIKCITITVNTRGWVLTSARVIPQRPEGTTNALVGFDSVNNLQYFNIGDGLSVEGNTLSVDQSLKLYSKIFTINRSDMDFSVASGKLMCKLTPTALQNYTNFGNELQNLEVCSVSTQFKWSDTYTSYCITQYSLNDAAHMVLYKGENQFLFVLNNNGNITTTNESISSLFANVIDSISLRFIVRPSKSSNPPK